VSKQRPGDLTFTVPGPPVPCARARVMRGGHAFTPERTQAYESLVAWHARAAMGKTRWLAAATGAFRVELAVYRNRRSGDVDNFSKAALDGMTKAGVWLDDALVDELLVKLRLDRTAPRLEVLVRRRLGGP
jgi:Holliday junction resolvase RusA-like endonuclease